MFPVCASLAGPSYATHLQTRYVLNPSLESNFFTSRNIANYSFSELRSLVQIRSSLRKRDDDLFNMMNCVVQTRKMTAYASCSLMVGCVIVKDGIVANEKLHPKARQLCAERRDDGYYMRRCVDLARKAIGYTTPNPMVGCIIVRDGAVVGEGFHPKAGQPHAEVFALRDAGDLAENATAYVNLEPCNHFGRTPPCTEALVRSKVKRVVVGMVDPNPIVASKGVERLRDAGIEVTVGVEEDLCKKLNEIYIHHMLTGNPFVALRYSLSVNGCFLDQLGEGVTSSGGYFSKLLKDYDAVIFSPTYKYPFLASREPLANQPLQVLVAKELCPLIQISDFGDEETSKLVIFSDDHGAVDPEISKTGIKTVILEKMSLRRMLEYCKGRGMCSVLIDLRGNFGVLEELLREGIEENLVRKIIIEVLPIWDDSENDKVGITLPSMGRKRLKDLVAWGAEVCGKSIVIEGYL